MILIVDWSLLISVLKPSDLLLCKALENNKKISPQSKRSKPRVFYASKFMFWIADSAISVKHQNAWKEAFVRRGLRFNISIVFLSISLIIPRNFDRIDQIGHFFALSLDSSSLADNASTAWWGGT